MVHIAGTEKFATDKTCRYSSSVAKNGNIEINGRSASIFRKSIGCCINP